NDHLKLLNLFAVSGLIEGRKKLQKMVYIAKKLNFPFQEKFDFHYYGPYSEELTLRIEELCNSGFLKEVKERKGDYIQFTYEMTESGFDFLASYSSDLANLKDCMVKMNKQSARFLELVSTILYFEHEPKEAVVQKVQTLKK